MSGYWQRKKKAASERSRHMNKVRWDAERERRAKLAAMNPIRHPGKIIRRIIVIDNERDVREAIFFDTDSFRDGRKKLKHVMEPNQ